MMDDGRGRRCFYAIIAKKSGIWGDTDYLIAYFNRPKTRFLLKIGVRYDILWASDTLRFWKSSLF
jgi:hypothetical protein